MGGPGAPRGFGEHLAGHAQAGDPGARACVSALFWGRGGQRGTDEGPEPLQAAEGPQPRGVGAPLPPLRGASAQVIGARGTPHPPPATTSGPPLAAPSRAPDSVSRPGSSLAWPGAAIGTLREGAERRKGVPSAGSGKKEATGLLGEPLPAGLLEGAAHGSGAPAPPEAGLLRRERAGTRGLAAGGGRGRGRCQERAGQQRRPLCLRAPGRAPARRPPLPRGRSLRRCE